MSATSKNVTLANTKTIFSFSAQKFSINFVVIHNTKVTVISKVKVIIVEKSPQLPPPCVLSLETTNEDSIN